MPNTPQIGARLTLADKDGVVLDTWNMDDWNLGRTAGCLELGAEIDDQIKLAAQPKAVGHSAKKAKHK